MKSASSSINSIKLVLSSPLFKSYLIKNIPELQDEEYSFSTFIYPHIEKEKWIKKPGSIVLVVFLCIFGLLLILSGIGLFFFYLRRRDHEKLLIYSLDGEHKNIISDDLPESKSILETPKNTKGVKLSGYAFRKSMLNSSRPSVVTPQFSITSLEQKKMSPLDKNGRVKSINIERSRSKSGASFDQSVPGNVFNKQHDSKESPALFSLKESGSTSEEKQTLKLNEFDLNNESDFDLKKIIEKENIETEKDGKIANEIKYPNVIDKKEENLNNNNNKHENGEEMKVEEVKELNKERNEEKEKENKEYEIGSEKQEKGEEKESEKQEKGKENDKDSEENEKKNDENVEKVREEEREEKVNEKIVNEEDKESKNSDNNKNETKEEKDNTPEPCDEEPNEIKNKNTDNNIIENISDEKEKTVDNKLKLEENEINNLEKNPESKEVIVNEKNAEVNLENDVEILKEEKNDMVLEDLDDISSPK